MENKFYELVTIIKEWETLGIKGTRNFTDINIKYDNVSCEWYVEIMGDEEIGYTVEEALDKQIKNLSTNKAYLEIKNLAFTNEMELENEFIEGWANGF